MRVLTTASSPSLDDECMRVLTTASSPSLDEECSHSNTEHALALSGWAKCGAPLPPLPVRYCARTACHACNWSTSPSSA